MNKKKKSPSFKSLRDKADKVFSEYIRNRDNWTCFICGVTGAGNNIHNGHLLKRGRWAVRFHELNCHALCYKCNMRDNYYPEYYHQKFLKTYGQNAYDDLILTSGIPVKKKEMCNKVILIYSLINKNNKERKENATDKIF